MKLTECFHLKLFNMFVPCDQSINYIASENAFIRHLLHSQESPKRQLVGLWIYTQFLVHLNS